MMRFVSTLILALSLGSGAVAQQAVPEIEAVCAELGRPNIDCACTARNVGTSVAIAPAAREMLIERYKYLVGQDNVLEAVMTGFMGDPDALLELAYALDQRGGAEPLLDDYEAPCVIAGAPPAQITAPLPGSPEDLLSGYCIAETGDARTCHCEAHAYATMLSPDIYDTYLVYLSGAENVPGENAMRTEIDAIRPFVQGRCYAMTHADALLGFSDAERAEIGLDTSAALASAGLNEPAGPADMTMAAPAEVLEAGCLGSGESAAFCACAATTFAADVAAAGLTDGAGRMTAYLLTAGGLSPMQNAQIVGTMSREDQTAGAMAMLSIQYGQGCAEQVAIDAAGGPVTVDVADARASMTAMCMEDIGEAAICECASDSLAESLGQDDFALMVTMRQADARGADDPVAAAAQALGRTQEDVQAQLMSNPALMGGEMQRSVMSCVMMGQ